VRLKAAFAQVDITPPVGTHVFPQKEAVCREVYPPVVGLGGGRMVRCHLYGSRGG
jgi:hypothetical protein